VIFHNGDRDGEVVTGNELWRRKGFDGIAVRRLGRALGHRTQLSWEDDRDVADVMADILDMRYMDLAPGEAALLLAGTDDPAEAQAILQGKAQR
jgi:hypothetical protein